MQNQMKEELIKSTIDILIIRSDSSVNYSNAHFKSLDRDNEMIKILNNWDSLALKKLRKSEHGNNANKLSMLMCWSSAGVTGWLDDMSVSLTWSDIKSYIQQQVDNIPFKAQISLFDLQKC